MQKSINVWIGFFVVCFLFSSLTARDYWWEQKAVGITIGHGSEQNRYDRGIVASAGFHDGFLSAWKIGDMTKNQTIPIGSIPTEIMLHYLTRNHKYNLTIGVISRQPHTLTGKSDILNFTGNIGQTWFYGENIYHKGSSSYEDTWLFLRLTRHWTLIESELGRASLGLGEGIGYTPKSTWHTRVETWWLPEDNSAPVLIRWVKRDIYFSHLVGGSFHLDLKYDLPKIPVSIGVMGQIFMKGGIFFWNWEHKVTEMIDGEITTGTQKWLVSDYNKKYAASLGGGFLFYLMGSWPL
ncbi:MAG: hypothetical protein PHW79_06555 [Candidatus Marinimicrobia bacterium]|nr:hypothetical protein [Candidatus Neomarinimicrobiota bacterium]